jgi:predicted GIY-YIG superfamily endonuclease
MCYKSLEMETPQLSVYVIKCTDNKYYVGSTNKK